MCGEGKRLVKCKDDGCFQYSTTCVSCFIRSHHYLPFHWALVWDPIRGFWNKFDYSALSEDTAIQLGHKGKDTCPSPRSPVIFYITHVNGIHTTRVRFCGCRGSLDRVGQLMAANLFPATTDEPQSAFSFALLQDFHMHNLQSKCSAFDYILSLRRLTDDVKTDSVPVSYYIYSL